MSARLKAAAGNKWRPIGTAPKDERIMLYLPSTGESWSKHVFVIGEWRDDEFAKKPKPYWTNDRERLFGRLWARDNQPTHWMPLPEPPELAERLEPIWEADDKEGGHEHHTD